MSVNEITREELFKAWDDFDKKIARESKGVDISQITVDELYSSHMKKSPDVLKLELSLRSLIRTELIFMICSI